jgi:hypothetical protein
MFVTQPRPGREELMALGAFAALTAELVRTGVELISRNLEVAQLRQALSSRVWIEQAKGSPSTRRSTPGRRPTPASRRPGRLAGGWRWPIAMWCRPAA